MHTGKNDGDSPRITTIIVCLNAEHFIGRAIKSFAEQTYGNKELIIIDGGSSDGTVDAIKASGTKAKVISEPDEGIFDAWNKGIKQASGDWIHFLGADDNYADKFVFQSMSEILNGAETKSLIVYGQVSIIDKDGKETHVNGAPWSAEDFRHIGMSLPHQGVFHHESLFRNYGLFETKSRYLHTYEMLLRYLRDHDAIFAGNILVARMETGGYSGRAENQLSLRIEYMRAQRMHGTFRFNRTLAFQLFSGLMLWVLVTILPLNMANDVIDWLRSLIGKPALYGRARQR